MACRGRRLPAVHLVERDVEGTGPEHELLTGPDVNAPAVVRFPLAKGASVGGPVLPAIEHDAHRGDQVVDAAHLARRVHPGRRDGG